MKDRICDVVVIDTMAAVTPGSNENSSEDVGKLIEHCKFIHKHTGALVVLIHHAGKDASKGARGWSGLRAAADAEIEITRNGDYRAAEVKKLKDGSDGEAMSFKLKVVPLGLDADGEEESSCVVEHVENAPVEPASRKAKPGPRESIVLDIIKTMAPSGTVGKDRIFERYKEKVSLEKGKRDQRSTHLTTTLTSLAAKGLAFKHGETNGEEQWSLTSLVKSGDEGWLG